MSLSWALDIAAQRSVSGPVRPPLARPCVARSLSLAGFQLVPESLKLIEPNHGLPAADRVTGFHDPSRLVSPQPSSRLGCRCYALSLSGPGRACHRPTSRLILRVFQKARGHPEAGLSFMRAFMVGRSVS